jgi:hypothetical protein
MSRLSRNDMLSTGGNRRRKSRGSCYVSKPSYGFFIAGSSCKRMNGVYVRDNPPRRRASSTKRESALYYRYVPRLGSLSCLSCLSCFFGTNII